MNRHLACLLAPLAFAAPAVAMLRLDNNRPPAAAWPQAEELHPTSWIVRRSREVIAGTPAARSLFLTTSFYAPHPPLFPPARLFEKFLRAQLPPAAMGAWVERASLKPAGDKSGARILLEGEALRRGAVSMQPVGLEDVMPTVLDLAGVRRPASVDGRGFVRRLAGRPEGFSDGQKLITGRAYPALQKAPQPKP